MTTANRAPSGQAGPIRQQLQRAAQRRMSRGIEQGFYLKAIALQESMIADRLESLLDDGGATKMLTLGILIKKALPLLGSDVLDQIDSWRKDRNAVLHQMGKYGDGFDLSWRERRAFAHEVVLSGVVVVRAADAEVRRAKRRS